MARVLVVFGTRSEDIKLSPVIKVLNNYPDKKRRTRGLLKDEKEYVFAY